MSNRIMVHVFWDIVLPLQRGKPGSQRRKVSNEEIAKVFRKSKYSGYKQNLTLADIYEESSIFITDDYRISNGMVYFKGTDGKEYQVPMTWIAFEQSYPRAFDIFDKMFPRKPL